LKFNENKESFNAKLGAKINNKFYIYVNYFLIQINLNKYFKKTFIYKNLLF